MRKYIFKIQDYFLDFDRSILLEKPNSPQEVSRYQEYIFILGAPRSGSTALCQAMLSSFCLGYLSNLMYLFPSRMSTIVRLTKHKILTSKNIKESDLGFIGGLNSPSECGRLFSFWFDDGNFEKKSMDIEKTFSYLSSVFQKPLLFKNLNNAFRVHKLKALFPSSKFIFIKRDPIYTCQSILLSRKKESKSYCEWWSVRPPGFEELLKESPFVQVAWQVFMIEKAILDALAQDLSLVSVQYERFCNSPQLEIEKIGQKLNLKHRQTRSDLSKIFNKDTRKISNKDWISLERAIDQFFG